MSVRIESSSDNNQLIQPGQVEQAKSQPAPNTPVPVENVRLSLSSSALEGARNESELSEVKSDGDQISSHSQAMDSIAWIRQQFQSNSAQAMASHGDSSASAVMQLLA